MIQAEPKTKATQRKSTFSASQLYVLNKLLTDRVDDLLAGLGVRVRTMGKTARGHCPVHGGDNPTAFSINRETGNWACFSASCHNQTANNLIGLVWAVNKRREDKNEFIDAVAYCMDFLGIDSSQLHMEDAAYQNMIDQSKFHIIHQKSNIESVGISREDFRKSVQIPCDFMVDKGFNSGIIDKYDAGLCSKNKFVMQNRVVLPIYDDDHENIVGFVGRSIFSECPTCRLHHAPKRKCLTKDEAVFGVKWYNYKINTNAVLFNYWHSKESIVKTNTAIIVEGQWDCMKLDQAGIKNSVGIFGSDISDQQLITLERSGAMRLILATDNDKAGIVCKKKIADLCKNLYEIVIPEYPTKDIDELSETQIKEIFGVYYG